MTVLELLNDTPAEFDVQGQTKFGELWLHLCRVSNAQGASFSIPGVQGGQYKEKDDEGNLLFKGLKKGGNDLLLVQVLTRHNQAGESYQTVKQYRSREFAGAEVHRYKNFGLPPIRNFFGTRIDDYLGQTSDRVLYSGKSAWVQLDEKPTGEEFDGNAITYWEIVKEYSDESAMRIAEEAFWNRVRGEGVQAEPVADLVELQTPTTGGWTAGTWREVGVPAIMKAKQEGKEAPEIAGTLGVDMPYVAEVLTKIPF